MKKSRIRFPAGSETVSTQYREDNWEAALYEKYRYSVKNTEIKFKVIALR